MDLDHLPDEVREILLDALVSYSDSCTLPRLTPTCPFYREGEQGPTCGEECRAIAERNGFSSRPLVSGEVGEGLVLSGRALPTSAASGIDPFDAQQRYLTDRRLPLPEQSTTALLLGLATTVRGPLLGAGDLDAERALAMWSELEGRGLPVERVFRGAIIPQMAFAVAVGCILPRMAELGFLAPHASIEFVDAARTGKSGDWKTLLEALVGSFPSRTEALLAGRASLLSPYGMPVPGVPHSASPLGQVGFDSDDVAPLFEDEAIVVAVSREFLGRVEEWLMRLLGDDLIAALRADAPTAPVFLALSPVDSVQDESGLWLWDRLTMTQPEDWCESSLLLEWRHNRGEYDGDCPERVLRERVTSHDDIAEHALERVSRSKGRRRVAPSLAPSGFVRKAVEHLRAGNWREASSIFQGLVDLRPADGDSWNNLGFCQLPGDVEAALRALGRASVFDRDQPLINVINRCLALHLLGRDDEAAALAETNMHLRQTTSRGHAFLWRHESRENDLVLVDDADPIANFDELYQHIKTGGCTPE